MTAPIPLTGGCEVHEHQKNPLYVFDPERAPGGLPRDHKGWPVFAVTLKDNRPVCGSRKASKPGLCESPFRYPNGRCKKHGGATPKGAAHPNFKTGRRSRYMPPPDLHERYVRALEDPELTHHRDSVALVDSLIEEILEGYEHGTNPEKWKAVQKAFRKCRVAENAGELHKARAHFEELGLLVEEGYRNSQQSLAILRLLEARRRHADSETKRKLSEEITFSYESAYTFYSAMGAAARKHFGHDPERLSAFVNEITAIGGAAGVQE
jgi:hypothetical protein